MKLGEQPAEVLDAVRTFRWDRIIEKHEGPERWSDTLEYSEPELLTIGGHDVLLPLDQEHHPNLTVLRCIESADSEVLTLFLRDTTYGTHWVECGYLAVCERFPELPFYLATVYHEWFWMDPRTGPFQE
jgi:hypothetical protein